MVPGDVIDLSVKAYYTNTSGFGTTPITSGAFAGAVSSAFGGLNGGTETQQATYNIFTALGVALLSGNNGTDDKPSAYLNYVVFDQNMVRNPNKSGYVGIGTGVNSEQTLSASNIEIDQAGFVYIYLSNESNSANYVYFDNLSVTVNESRILEKSDYYPGGLTFNGYEKAGMINQRYKYNQGTGKKQFKTERVTALGLNLDMTKYRMYDYSLLRFWQVDPKADVAGQETWTPYHYSFNNPIRYNDPYGDCPPWICGGINKVLDNVQGALDVAGLAPGIGIVADVANAVISVGRGDAAGAGLNMAAAVPGAGLAVGAAKVVKTTAKVVDKANDTKKTFQTYTKVNKKTGEVYTGRTSGTNSPRKNVANRDKNHHKNKEGFGRAKLDKTSSNKDAIRGREQQGIEANGGAKSQNGTSGNAINGVGPKNKKAQQYKDAANKEFGTGG